MEDRVNEKSFGEAIKAALRWLRMHGVTSLDVPFEGKFGSFGMRTSDRSAGYRIEVHPIPPGKEFEAHINVWWRHFKGPHYVFPGNERAVKSLWRQLFLWDPKLQRSMRKD